METGKYAGTPPDKDARTWAMLCHLTALSGAFVPLGHILGPLIVWAVKRDDHPFIDEQGRESLNFQLTMTIPLVLSAILVFIVIGIPLLLAVAVFDLVMIVVASVRANEGFAHRYPLTIRFIAGPGASA